MRLMLRVKMEVIMCMILIVRCWLKTRTKLNLNRRAKVDWMEDGPCCEPPKGVAKLCMQPTNRFACMHRQTRNGPAQPVLHLAYVLGRSERR